MAHCECPDCKDSDCPNSKDQMEWRESVIPSTDLLGFRLPPDAAKKFNKLTANDWTKEDWADLLKAQNWVIASVAARHGISEPNG